MENLLVRCRDPQPVVEAIVAFRPDRLDTFAPPRRWPERTRYRPYFPTTVKVSPLRQSMDKSPDFERYYASVYSNGGEDLQYEWLIIVDRHDHIDLRLACWLSQRLSTTVLALHASDATDEYGFCSYGDGELEEDFFREMEERPTYRVNKMLEGRGVPHVIRRYRDFTGPGWRTVDLDLPDS